ncbi:MAG TPA: type II secretion system protein GspL [Burkholderiaceae bacterium]|nr:type II secretion system protein GspL [Burkholderiaceae bacterium]HQR72043.1 type II secretion system protein GspL [Burkholderiaceae bacterium]
MKEKSLQRLLVFVPPRRSFGAKGHMSTGTVVSYVAPGSAAAAAETPLALLPKAAAVELVFDPADVFVTAIEPPKLSEGKLRLALPNLLEDRLLADANDCHFGFNIPRGGTGSTTIAAMPKMPVAVIDRGVLTHALDACTEAGYRVRAAYSEIYTLPAPAAGVLSVRLDRGRGVARSATHDGFAFDLAGDEVPPALALAVRQLGIRRIQAYGREAGRMNAIAVALNVQVDVAQSEVDASSIEGAVNLLQGSFAPGGLLGGLMPLAGRATGLRGASLKVPLIWGAVGATVAIAGMNAYWLKLESESKAIKQQMENAFRANFPETTAIVDPVLQTKRQLDGLRARAGLPSANDFSVLNARTALLLTAAPLGSVTAIDYRDGALKVKFKSGTADNPAFQNTLRAAGVQQGLAVRFEADGSARVTAAGS